MTKPNPAEPETAVIMQLGLERKELFSVGLFRTWDSAQQYVAECYQEYEPEPLAQYGAGHKIRRQVFHRPEQGQFVLLEEVKFRDWPV